MSAPLALAKPSELFVLSTDEFEFESLVLLAFALTTSSLCSVVGVCIGSVSVGVKVLLSISVNGLEVLSGSRLA